MIQNKTASSEQSNAEAKAMSRPYEEWL